MVASNYEVGQIYQQGTEFRKITPKLRDGFAKVQKEGTLKLNRRWRTFTKSAKVSLKQCRSAYVVELKRRPMKTAEDRYSPRHPQRCGISGQTCRQDVRS